ncbi:MAG: thioesterase family protein [Boseongicola sp.]|nr:thioesterase family protein [Boseongicola sp.]
MFTFPQRVSFKHCDPAGIVFFPRYFEMINDCMENFFADVLQVPFEKMMPANGVPTAQISTRFTAPSRHGDRLALSLKVTKVGRTSFSYEMAAACGDEQRFETTGTLVCVNRAGRPTPWPPALKDRLSAEKDQNQ